VKQPFLAFVSLFVLSSCSTLILNPVVKTNIYKQPVDFHVETFDLEKTINKGELQKEYLLLKKQLINLNITLIEQQLVWITKNKSLDAATLFLISYLHNDKINLDINQKYQNNIKNITNNQQLSDKYRAYYYLFIPGWLYKTIPDTGADFKAIRKKLMDNGLNNELLAINENGTIAENAKTVINRINELNNKKVILVTVSKSGAEVASFINDGYLEQTPQLKGWVNISGLLKGSPLASYANTFPMDLSTSFIFYINDLNKITIKELEHHKQKQYFRNYSQNKKFKIINIVAIPFYDQISFDGWFGYQLLYDNGPNDGRALIIDQLAPGKTLVEIGLDHYYQDSNMPTKALAIMKTFVDDLEQ